jgi:toxin YoeB
LVELENHPETGEGRPERLKNNLQTFWLRNINQKERMIYAINDDALMVEVLSALGHYSDK